MELIQYINISLKDYRFKGRCFDPEVIYNFIELEIDEIYDLGYVMVSKDDGHEYDYNLQTHPILSEECDKCKTVYDILSIVEERGRLDTATMRFTNGLYLSYGIQGHLNLQINNEKLFFEYCNTILKQYGYLPDRIYELANLYPDKDVYITRPGIMFAVEDAQILKLD